MTKLSSSLLRFLTLACTCSITISVSAEVRYGEESQKRIKLSQTVQPQGPNPFGESVNLYTGDVSFSQTDVAAEGTGPNISIVRNFEQLDQLGETSPQLSAGFGDWRLAIPHIETLTPGDAGTGANAFVGQWKVGFSPGSLDRCTNFSSMWTPQVGETGIPRFGGMDSSEWWRGYQLLIPGEGKRDILARAQGNTIKPSTGFFPGVTTDHWQIGCGITTTNGQPGEGFVVLAPDGRKFFMTHLVYSDYESFLSQFQEDEGSPAYFQRLTRKVARMYASKVEDRFGNVVNYNYSGNTLVGITASDGRSVSIEWWTDAPVIKKITLQAASPNPRIWQYEYADRTTAAPRLTKVILPDGSFWEYSLAGIRAADFPVRLDAGCLPANPTNISTDREYMAPVEGATVRAPSGLLGEFSFAARLNGQSYLPTDCNPQTAAESDNPFFSSKALTQKAISGPGIARMFWSYNYENAHANAQRFCPSPTSCQSTSYTDVTDPSSITTRYVHSTRWDAKEGRLLRTEIGLANGVAKRIETLDYYLPAGDRPQQSSIGYAMQFGSTNIYKIENIVPVQRKTVTQDSVIFSTIVNSFDSYVRPTSVTKQSSSSP